jgi:Domain of Unknown Function (DUF1080)
MIGSPSVITAGPLGRRPGRCLFALLILSSIPFRATGSEDFGALFADSSLQHTIGDHDHWSFHDGVLMAKTDPAATESIFLLRQERFGNFILKFQARSDGAAMNVVFRASILPPGQLAGFATTVGGEQWGNLTFRKPIAHFPEVTSQGSGHAAPGFPDAAGMPFLRAAAEVELVHAGSSTTGMTFPQGQWVDCEIDGLGNHILVKVNGETTARYHVDDSFYQKVVGFHPPAEMTGKNDPFYEGMIGFQVPPGTAGKVELKDIQIKMIGDVHWSEGAAAGDSNNSKESWKASDPAFKRITDAEWSQETHDILQIASKDESFRQLFDGSSLHGWSNSANFWTVQDGVIAGQPRNAFLVTDREYGDFILKGSVRLSPAGSNSGIQLRSTVISDGMRGYQFDMGIPWWGQLYVESTLRGILAPVEDRMKRVNLAHGEGWNDFVMACKGNHVIGELNGEVTFDVVDYYGDKTGLIGLQLHAGAPMTAGFRNLTIKELH